MPQLPTKMPEERVSGTLSKLVLQPGEYRFFLLDNFSRPAELFLFDGDKSPSGKFKMMALVDILAQSNNVSTASPLYAVRDSRTVLLGIQTPSKTLLMRRTALE